MRAWAFLIAVTCAIACARGDLLYIATSGGSVMKYTDKGVSAGTLAGGPSPMGITTDTAGNIYVSNYGGPLRKFPVAGGSVDLDTSGLAVYLACDAGGTLFACNYLNEIVKYSSDGTPTVFVDHGLNGPSGLAFDSAGYLYVSNYTTNTISKIAVDGTMTTFASTGLTGPTGMAFDRFGNLFVANDDANTITKFTPDGHGTLFANKGLSMPQGLAFDSAGNLYASNSYNSTIEKFTSAGVASQFLKNVDIPQSIIVTPEPQTAVLAITGLLAVSRRGRKGGRPVMGSFRNRRSASR